MANTGVVEIDFTGTGSSDGLIADSDANVSLDFSTGSGAGTVQLFRSFDSGVTWKPKALAEYTDDAEDVAESQGIVAYKLECTAYTSGTITARLST